MRSGQKSSGKRSRFVESLEPRRLLSGGSLDTTFNSPHGTDSIIFNNLTVTGHATAVQSDGKIVEVGKTNGSSYSVVRYDANGQADTTFGPNHDGEIVAHMQASGFNDIADAVAIQPDGKILVAGETDNPRVVGSNSNHMFVVRYTSSGSLDTSFGTGGIVLLSSFDSDTAKAEAAYGLAIQTDGKIVVAGYELQGLVHQNDNIAIARLNTNGSLDTSFNGDGKANIDLGQNEVAESVAIDYNGTPSTNSDYGKIVIAGHQTTGFDNIDLLINNVEAGGGGDPVATYKIVIARYNTNGTPDKTFNGSGVLLTNAGFAAPSIDARALVIESGGKIVIAGSEGKNLGSTDHHFFLARFNENGTLDKTFGTGGDTTTSFGDNDYATSLVVGGFGQQLIAGGTADGRFALAAYTLDGHPFSEFGTKGQVITNGDNNVSNVQLALSPNHTIVAGGGVGFNTARYFDIGPDVTVSALDPTAGPTTYKRVGNVFVAVANNASITVARDENLSVDTKVYFTVGGTAIAPSLNSEEKNTENYTLSGMTASPGALGKTIYSVDIPAGQTFVIVTLTPKNIPANTQTATFTIQSNVDYQIGSQPSQTITILGTNPITPTMLTPTADAYVRDGSSADTNFGTVNQLLVKKSGTVGDNREAYFKFDLSSVSTINTVTLSLFGQLSNTSNTNLESDLYSVADTSWTETGITYDNKPAAGSKLASAIIQNTTPQTYTFDITAYVKAQLAAGHKIISLVLMNPSASGSAFEFNSREASSNQPTLTIT